MLINAAIIYVGVLFASLVIAMALFMVTYCK